MTHTQEKKQEAETARERTKMLGLTDKGIKVAIINIFKEVRENMFYDLKDI